MYRVSLAIPATAADKSIANGVSKNGFILTPIDGDSTGISPDTDFLLESQGDISLEALKSALSIDGEPAPVIKASAAKKFNITPSRPLLENSLYVFRLKLENETTWTFQTRQTFSVIGTLPSDKSVNVPTNSGIEINFSYEDYGDIEKYFEISPKVDGKFERHKKTAVFVPKKLDEGTLYTVRIKKGLPLKNTNRALDEDYIFTFETYKITDETPKTEVNGSISYSRNIFDYKTNTAPQIPICYMSIMVYKNPECIHQNIYTKLIILRTFLKTHST